MRLSLTFIYEKIRTLYPAARIDAGTSIQSLRKQSLGTLGTLPQRILPELDGMGALKDRAEQPLNTLLFDIEDKVFNLAPPEQTECALVTTESRSVSYTNWPRIIVPDGTNMLSLMGDVGILFSTYNRWAENVRDAIDSECNLQRITTLVAEQNGNPVYISDSDFKMLAYSHSGVMSEVDATWRYHTHNKFLPFSVMESLIKTGELQACHATFRTGLFLGSLNFQTPYACRAIMRGKSIFGLLVTLRLNRNIDVCDMELMDYVGDLLSTSLEVRSHDSVDTTGFYHTRFFVDILTGTLTDKQLVSEQIGVFDWNMNDSYQVLVIDTHEDNDAMKHLLLAAFEPYDCRCLVFQDNIVCVLHNTQDPSEEESTHFAWITRSFNRSCGESERFSNFLDLRLYWRQALFALEHAQRKAHVRLVKYKHVYLEHIAELSARATPPLASIVRLHEIDSTEGSDLCHTLQIWLMNGKNTLQTAQKLFVHRNTVGHRIRRITKITDLDFDDQAACIRALLSLISLSEPTHETTSV